MMAGLAVEVMGWTGAFLLLLAYFLLTKKKISSKSLHYQGMNLVGSVLVGVNAFFNGAYPSLMINVIWLIIAFWGIEKFFHKG